VTPFGDKVVAVTGGTGSLGQELVRSLLAGQAGTPRKVIVFSRDEAKQHVMRLEYRRHRRATDEIIYDNFGRLLEFRIGDVRDYAAVCSLLDGVDVVVNAAGLKQVPTCEYFPYEAVQTNITGAEHIVRAIRHHRFPVETVVGISSDKACEPVNVMGMTKAIQERIFITANVTLPRCRFVCVRYGNVLASRGSAIPLFHDQILAGGPLTVTTDQMTRFFLPLSRAVETIFAAVADGGRGDVYVPRIAAARIIDVARALVGDQDIPIVRTGIRPGEKVHETLVSDEEGLRTVVRGDYYVIAPMLPELTRARGSERVLARRYGSDDDVLSFAETVDLLKRHHLMLDQLDAAGDGPAFP
jgi:FlaA1/EpsC-like NDP-sugar epimerase